MRSSTYAAPCILYVTKSNSLCIAPLFWIVCVLLLYIIFSGACIILLLLTILAYSELTCVFSLVITLTLLTLYYGLCRAQSATKLCRALSRTKLCRALSSTKSICMGLSWTLTCFRLNNCKCILIKKGKFGFFERVPLTKPGFEPGTSRIAEQRSTTTLSRLAWKCCLIWTNCIRSDRFAIAMHASKGIF